MRCDAMRYDAMRDDAMRDEIWNPANRVILPNHFAHDPAIFNRRDGLETY